MRADRAPSSSRPRRGTRPTPAHGWSRATYGCGWPDCACWSRVPFGHLVADPALLPPESIRFFHVDRGWTDALVEGALSVGTVTTADRAALEALYGIVRAEVDEAERLVRLPGWEPGAAVPDRSGRSGDRVPAPLPAGLRLAGPARAGLRQGQPGAARRRSPTTRSAKSDDATLGKLGLLRLERLAPAVLLALFDGVPQVVHIEEPRAGVQFGVDETGDGRRRLGRGPAA